MLLLTISSLVIKDDYVIVNFTEPRVKCLLKIDNKEDRDALCKIMKRATSLELEKK